MKAAAGSLSSQGRRRRGFEPRKWWLLPILLIFTACAQVGKVTVVVTDYETGDPVEGATVFAGFVQVMEGGGESVCCQLYAPFLTTTAYTWDVNGNLSPYFSPVICCGPRCARPFRQRRNGSLPSGTFSPRGTPAHAGRFATFTASP
jgi:hypothetical protein